MCYRATTLVALLLLLMPAAGWSQRAVERRVAGPAARVPEATSEEAVYDLLRAQLGALLEAQDAAREVRGRYAQGFGRRGEALAFQPSAGVTIALDHVDALGWAATASHAALPGRTCVVWVGQVPPSRRPSTQQDGNRGGDAEVVCDLVP